MAEVVNLRQVRKAKLRAERRRTADENALAHGVRKADRQRAKTEREAAERYLDGTIRSPTPPDTSTDVSE
ncbi:MAG: DUF4169 family protein [Pseudomonadota bacterium]